MGDTGSEAWQYTASYGWNWRSIAAMGRSLSSLVLPMPSWLRAVAARGLLTRTALHADARGISGSCWPSPPGGAEPCPWSEDTDILI